MAYGLDRDWPQDLNDIVPFNSDCGVTISHEDYDNPSYNSSARIQTQFKTKKLKNWDSQDIFDWIQDFSREKGFDASYINVTGFTIYSGSKLMKMTIQKFLEIDNIYGQELYNSLAPFRSVKTSGGGIISERSMEASRSASPLFIYDQYQDDIFARTSSRNSGDLLSVDSLDYPSHSFNHSSSPCHMMNNLCLENPEDTFGTERLSPQPAYSQDYQNDNSYHLPNAMRNFSPAPGDYYLDDNELNTSFNTQTLAELTEEDLIVLDNANNDYPDMTTPNWDLLRSESLSGSGPNSSSVVSHTSRRAVDITQNPEILAGCGRAITGRTKRRSGSCSKLRSSSPSKRRSSSKVSLVKTASKQNKKEAGKKVWEFLLDLLNDPDSNPKLIRWEDRSQGVFRLIEHDLIAQKWGMRREKADLPYDYFARTIRYQYTTNMLESVPTRKLVYKFGPQVMERLRAQDML